MNSKLDLLTKVIQTVVYDCIRNCAHISNEFPVQPAKPGTPKAGSPSILGLLAKVIQTVVYGCIRKCAHNFDDFPGQRPQHDKQPSQPRQVAQPACQRSSTELTLSAGWDLVLQLCYAGCFSYAHCILDTHIAFRSSGAVKSALRVTQNTMPFRRCIMHNACSSTHVVLLRTSFVFAQPSHFERCRGCAKLRGSTKFVV